MYPRGVHEGTEHGRLVTMTASNPSWAPGHQGVLNCAWPGIRSGEKLPTISPEASSPTSGDKRANKQWPQNVTPVTLF